VIDLAGLTQPLLFHGNILVARSASESIQSLRLCCAELKWPASRQGPKFDHVSANGLGSDDRDAVLTFRHLHPLLRSSHSGALCGQSFVEAWLIWQETFENGARMLTR